MAEKSNRSQLLKSSFGTALATLASRALGLLRVALEARVLGGGDICSAWHFATSIPNLFRRLLGEGALGAALIPLIAETEKTKGPDEVRRELGIIFATLGAILAAIVILLGGGAWILERATAGATGMFGTLRMRICLQLLPILMPYAFFICLVGVIGSVLNYSRVFVLPALGALLMNIFLVGGLYYLRQASGGKLDDVAAFLPFLAILVLISGAVQLVLMLVLLAAYGRFPRWSLRKFRDLGVAKKLFKLALPGIIGGAALQMSFLVDRWIAMWLGARAVPALTFVDRIVDVPIGIFAMSLSTVLMAAMARSALESNEKLADDLAFGLRHVCFMCIPLAMLVIFFHEPMLRLLCRGGNYTERDLEAAHLVAVFYGMGIPFFCSLKVILPAFFARKIMDKPLYCSLTAISINIVLNLILMHPLEQGGIALATTVASLVHNTLLLILLHRGGVSLRPREVVPCCARSLLLALLTGGGAFLLHRYFRGAGERSWWSELALLVAAVSLFGGSYFSGAVLFRAREPKEFLGMLRRRKNGA